MNAYKRFTWLLIGSLSMMVVFGLALSSPSRVAGQDQGTPTHVPPPPRTLPPGPRLTPTPQPAEVTPQPTSERPENTPTPVILLPKSGGSTGGVDHSFGFVVIAAIGLLALSLISARRSRTE